MNWEVPPLDQVLPAVILDIKVTVPPAQKVVGPVVEIVGVVGVGLTTIVFGAEVAEHVPFDTVTK